jgi:hypothetical protein
MMRFSSIHMKERKNLVFSTIQPIRRLTRVPLLNPYPQHMDDQVYGVKVSQRRTIFSATSSRITQRRWVHTETNELLLAVAPYLPQIKEHLIETVNSLPQIAETVSRDVHSVAEMAENLPQLQAEAGPAAETPDFAKQLLDAKRKRIERIEYNELQNFLENIKLPENFELECKKLEYEIFLGNTDFHFQCLRVLKGHKLPMLQEKDSHLFNLFEEEQKLRCLLRSLLAKYKKEYTLSNLWRLKRDLSKPGGIKSILNPFLSEFRRKRRGMGGRQGAAL